MDVTIQGHNIRVTEALESYTRKQLDKLDRYLPNIYDVRVDLAHESTRRGEDVVSAQITVRHQRGAILRAEDRATRDVNLAINAAVDKLYRQIQRFKGKRSPKGREKFTATVEEINAAEAIPNMAEFVDEAPEQVAILRRKPVNVDAMNEAEAIEQMELLGHNFFVFFNADSGVMNVLYKRAAGGYGLLIPTAQ